MSSKQKNAPNTTEPTDEELEELRDENAEYKDRIEKIRRETEVLVRRHNHRRKEKNATNEFSETNAHITPELRDVLKRNDDLKRERIRVTAELQHCDTGHRIAEVKNSITMVDKTVQGLQSEIKSLEMVQKGQSDVYSVAKHNEDEMRYIRDAQRQELNGFREEWNEARAEEKFLERLLTTHQMKYHLTKEKIALGFTGESVAALKRQVEDQDAQIQRMRDQVAAKNSDVDRDHRRAKAEDRHLLKQKETLTAKIEELKATMAERERELKLSYAVSDRRRKQHSA